nr:cell wall hydrolase [Acinetobacter sp. MB5]
MGLALDIHFNKNGTRTTELSDMEFIRKDVMAKKMDASEKRHINKIYLEPKVFESGKSGATTWVHFDVTLLSNEYFRNSLFKKSVADLNGEKLLNIINKINKGSLLLCSGLTSKNNISEFDSELVLSRDDIIDIMKVTETEIIQFKTEKFFYEQAAGVVDTILNRTKSGVWGRTVRSVVNAPRQFSKITGPQNLKPYGSVQNMPLAKVSARIRNFVNSYLLERSKGKRSIVGGNLNYANKYYSDEYNRRLWVDKFHDQAVKTGLVFGYGKAIHAHGTVEELKSKMPKPFKVVLPINFKGI